jgi:hypothetical protein
MSVNPPFLHVGGEFGPEGALYQEIVPAKVPLERLAFQKLIEIRSSAFSFQIAASVGYDMPRKHIGGLHGSHLRFVDEGMASVAECLPLLTQQEDRPHHVGGLALKAITGFEEVGDAPIETSSAHPFSDSEKGMVTK